MTIAEAKQVRIVDFLAQLGHHAQHIKSEQYWYFSPLRNERTPSFKVNDRINEWYDFGEATGGGGLDMFGNFFRNLGSGNVSGLSIAGLVAAAFLIFGRFGWLGKIAGAFLGMMLIGNNAGVFRTPETENVQRTRTPELPAEEQTHGGGMRR